MTNTVGPKDGNRGAADCKTCNIGQTAASTWNSTEISVCNFRFVLPALIIGLALSSSVFAQITIDGRYWKYD